MPPSKPPSGIFSRVTPKRRCALGLGLGGLLLSIPARAGGQFEPADGRPLRITVETGLGIAGTLGGGLALGGLGYGGSLLAGADDDCDGNGFMCLPETVAFAGVGAILGAVGGLGLGVWVGGEVMDANGALWAAYAGEGIGLATAIGVPLLLDEESLLFFTLLTLPLAGAITGYELSTSRTGSTATASQALRLTSPPPPLVGFSGRF